jgi:hypothetical protein
MDIYVTLLLLHMEFNVKEKNHCLEHIPNFAKIDDPLIQIAQILSALSLLGSELSVSTILTVPTFQTSFLHNGVYVGFPLLLRATRILKALST